MAMCAEFLREAAVLIAVFGPLDLHMYSRLTWQNFASMLAFSGCLLLAGILMEVYRDA